MPINLVGTQAVSFKKDDKSNSTIPVALAGAATGVGVGYYTGEPLPAKSIHNLDADTFEKCLKNPEKMSDAEKAKVAKIKDLLAKNVSLKSNIEDGVIEYFDGKKEISVEEYIQKTVGGKISSKEQLEKLIGKQDEILNKLSTKYIVTSQELDKLIVESDEILKIDPAEASKTEKFIKVQKEILKKQKKLEKINTCFSKRNKSILSNKSCLEATSLAKDGKITSKALQDYVYTKNGFKGAAVNKIDEAAKGLEKFLPKVNSWKKGAIFAGIGTIAALALSIVIGPKSKNTEKA